MADLRPTRTFSIQKVKNLWRNAHTSLKDARAPIHSMRSFAQITISTERLPVAHGQIQSDQDTIRAGVAALFRGETALPLIVKEMPADPETAAHLKNVLAKANAWFDANKP